MPSEQSLTVFIKQLCADPGQLEFPKVLLTEAFVRCEENDSIQLTPALMFLQIVLILENVRVHQKSFAASGGTPVRDLVQLRPRLTVNLQWCDLIRLGLVDIVES